MPALHKFVMSLFGPHSNPGPSFLGLRLDDIDSSSAVQPIQRNFLDSRLVDLPTVSYLGILVTHLSGTLALAAPEAVAALG